MFQFTTTNIINSHYEAGYLPSGVEGTDNLHSIWSMQEATEERGASLVLKRIGKFCVDNITHVYKVEATAPKPAKVSFNLAQLSTVKEGDMLRLNIRVGLTQGSNSSFYANDDYHKNHPFFIDFVWKGAASDVAKNIEKVINKNELNVYGEKFMNVKASGTSIEFEAVNEYQRFIKADIERFVPNDAMKDFEVLAVAEVATESNPTPTHEITLGNEGFGTYSWILHNLRIPTSARTDFMAVNHEENPIPGAKYNQYTIHYCVNRGTLGTNAVGDQVTSHTTHVLYIKDDLCKDFETILKEILGDKQIEVIKARSAK